MVFAIFGAVITPGGFISAIFGAIASGHSVSLIYVEVFIQLEVFLTCTNILPMYVSKLQIFFILTELACFLSIR